MARELDELEHLLEAAETLREIQSRRPAIARFVAENTLSAKSHATVFEGRYDSRPAALKLFHGPDRTQQARHQKRELTRLAANMHTGDCRVPPLLAAWPGEGITITALVRGTSLDRRLATALADQRDALLAHAGRWLARLVGPAIRQTEFGGRYWVQARTRDMAALAGGRDGAMAQALAARLAAMLPTVAGRPITQARSHGDFAPANLILTDEALYGIDIQNAHLLPLAKDVARFLVYLQATCPRATDRHHFGIAAADLDALTAPLAVLSTEDRRRHLPFFIAVELADKFRTTDHARPKAQNLRAAITRLLDSPTP